MDKRNTLERRKPRQKRAVVFLLLAGLLGLGVLLAALLSHPAANPDAALPSAAQPSEDSGTAPVPSAENAETDGEDAWMLRLVNPWNPLPEDYSIETVELRNGFQVDARCYPDLQEMMDACRGEGLSPLICSAYRTWEYQERLYQAKVEEYLAEGYSQDAAEAEAGTVVAVPGTSEHQLGLAVDIVDVSNQVLDESQEDTEVQRWLMAHSWEYGFILRYPSEKSEITGIIYEPWHYRYVGREYAKLIFERGVCLEEYLGDA